MFTNCPAQSTTHRYLSNFRGIDSISAGKAIKSPPYYLVQRSWKHSLISGTTNWQQSIQNGNFCILSIPSPNHNTSSLKCISQEGDLIHTALNRLCSLTKVPIGDDPKQFQQKKEEIQCMDIMVRRIQWGSRNYQVSGNNASSPWIK